jgi:hypothetical protein
VDQKRPSESQISRTARTEQQNGDIYLIHEKDVRRFILEHPTDIDLRRVDQIWFLDLITNGLVCAARAASPCNCPIAQMKTPDDVGRRTAGSGIGGSIVTVSRPSVGLRATIRQFGGL